MGSSGTGEETLAQCVVFGAWSGRPRQGSGKLQELEASCDGEDDAGPEWWTRGPRRREGCKPNITYCEMSPKDLLVGHSLTLIKSCKLLVPHSVSERLKRNTVELL